MLAVVKIVFLASLMLPESTPAPLTAAKENVSATPAAEASATPEARPAILASASAHAPAQASRTADTARLDQGDILAAALNGGKQAQSFLAELSPARQIRTDDAQAELAQASSRSALSLPRLMGASVAYAADMPPVQPVMPPAPTVRPMESPITPERVVRPDEITPQAPPAPEVAPFVSRDSAAQKQAELNRREQELLALQQQMESRMTELHSLETRIQGMLQDANTTQDSKFKQMVDMYSNMKPRQAAQALSSMDEAIAVKILTGMKSKQSGEVISYMDSKNAARLSEVMSKMQL